MENFTLEEYRQFKEFLKVLPIVQRSLDPRSSAGREAEFHDCATKIYTEMYAVEKSFDQKVQRQYYEYQELHATMEAFLEFYSAMTMPDEFDSKQQQNLVNSLTKTRRHLNNFLKTRKIG